MSDPYIGEIKIFPYAYAPVGFLSCQGQVVGVTQYSTLFALISNKFGGDGRTNFALPNLAGRTPVGVGVAAGGGTNTWSVGSTFGQETVALISSQYPAHNHIISHPTGTTAAANAYAPQAGSLMSNANPAQFFAAPAASANTIMQQKTLAPYDGGGPAVQAHTNKQPYLVLLPCIATVGVFPSFT